MTGTADLEKLEFISALVAPEKKNFLASEMSSGLGYKNAVRTAILTFQTLTPIWTGDVDGSAATGIFEQSILGGLRWWFEALARGGHRAVPDPVSQPARYDRDLLYKGLDPTSEVFGATGWRRRFRLIVEPVGQLQKADISEHVDGPHHGWHFRSKPRSGVFRIKLLPLALDFDSKLIAQLIQLVVRYAALGARNQMGFGVVKLEKVPFMTPQETDPDLLDELMADLHAAPAPGSDMGLPALSNIFLSKVRLAAHAPDDPSFQLKLDLRDDPILANWALKSFFLGKAERDDRMGSKLCMSRPYAEDGVQFMKVWGWFPRDEPQAGQRNAVLDLVKSLLTANYGIPDYWREFDSKRDTSAVYTNLLDFYRSL